MVLSDEEKKVKRQEYYQKNKKEILEKQKESRIKMNKFLQEQNKYKIKQKKGATVRFFNFYK